MQRRTLALVAANVILGAAVAVGTAVPATAAQDAAALVTTLTYDDSGARQYSTEIAQGAANWNAAVTNVRIVKATSGQRVNIRIVADPGWPQATLGPVRSTGSAQVWFGKQAVDQGYNKVRIITHELGHNLGLPDRRTGLCSDLMSGSSAPVSCNNAQPSAAEKASVQRNYATGLASRQVPATIVISDAA
ncbi:snapalysin family zinc-dependent metalloprotease [Actinokineospora sp. NBRC 105648]|uniref:snapalysin family zinc-dependent metalloprotease n=1 Tax=Actinokineospora sp. NBRC 105648 TaxID=3032206 RepID=UPI0024A5E6EE|nr:snapalysin family zinc-dependent metalloprotease [Actinokineospora sp. NBRC 105648]GLZ42388.1 peptidase [Actinokineospora sp. NBRC 105648]